MIIINADDFGVDRNTTQKILHAFHAGAVSSTSLMVFMKDSEFAAKAAIQSGLDIGLHLNFTMPFHSDHVSPSLVNAHGRVSKYLLNHRIAQILYNRRLAKDFDYLFKSQMDEFIRIYGNVPSHFDGHHHMHLSANIIFANYFPHGSWVRRNFTYRPGEKGYINWTYRRILDMWIRTRYRCCDFFDSIEPIDNEQRLSNIFRCAGKNLFELEVHPVREEQFRLLEGEYFKTLLSNTVLTNFKDLNKLSLTARVFPK